LLSTERIRHDALSCIVIGTTPEMLREAAASLQIADLGPMWLALADEIELLAACGVTGRSARDAAKIALVANDATAADFRAPEAYRDLPGTRRRVRMIADEMDALRADGFDPAAYEKEIDLACRRSPASGPHGASSLN
jgi:hypothetical protein